MMRFEHQKPGAGGFAVAADLEAYGSRFFPFRQHDLHFVARSERAGEPNVSNAGEDAGSP